MIYGWQISVWKDASRHMLLGNHKVKEQGTPIHLLGCLKSKPPTTPNAGEDMEPRGLSLIAGGNANGASIWKTARQFLLKLNGFLPSNSTITSWYLPKRVENMST